jgi:hypothetical protein
MAVRHAAKGGRDANRRQAGKFSDKPECSALSTIKFSRGRTAMSKDALPSHTDASWPPAAAAAFDADDAVLGGLAWWLTGGASLALWTGLALLLTSA